MLMILDILDYFIIVEIVTETSGFSSIAIQVGALQTLVSSAGRVC
jgi:hypothetical protein